MNAKTPRLHVVQSPADARLIIALQHELSLKAGRSVSVAHVVRQAIRALAIQLNIQPE